MSESQLQIGDMVRIKGQPDGRVLTVVSMNFDTSKPQLYGIGLIYWNGQQYQTISVPSGQCLVFVDN